MIDDCLHVAPGAVALARVPGVARRERPKRFRDAARMLLHRLVVHMAEMKIAKFRLAPIAGTLCGHCGRKVLRAALVPVGCPDQNPSKTIVPTGGRGEVDRNASLVSKVCVQSQSKSTAAVSVVIALNNSDGNSGMFSERRFDDIDHGAKANRENARPTGVNVERVAGGFRAVG